MNSCALTWYLIPSPPVCRSVLYLAVDENANRGSGVGGVLNKFGSAVIRENKKSIRIGRSWTSVERVSRSCCCCGVPARFVLTRVVLNEPPGPNEAEKTVTAVS